MAKKVFCDICDAVMTPSGMVVNIYDQKKGRDVMYVAVQDNSEQDNSEHDVCEACICKAFAKKLTTAQLRGLTCAKEVAKPFEGATSGGWTAQVDDGDFKGGTSTMEGAGSERVTHTAAAYAPGAKVVSRTVTDKMRDAALRLHGTKPFPGTAAYHCSIWEAMFDAA